MKTVPEWARHYCINVRTAQNHRQSLGIGTMHGHSYVLTAAEWERVHESILAAVAKGRGKWGKK